jgi:hypothetical protein
VAKLTEMWEAGRIRTPRNRQEWLAVQGAVAVYVDGRILINKEGGFESGTGFLLPDRFNPRQQEFRVQSSKGATSDGGCGVCPGRGNVEGNHYVLSGTRTRSLPAPPDAGPVSRSDRTRTGLSAHRILSPVRPPVPPTGHGTVGPPEARVRRDPFRALSQLPPSRAARDTIDAGRAKTSSGMSTLTSTSSIVNCMANWVMTISDLWGIRTPPAGR